MKKKTSIRYGELTPARPIAAVPVPPRAPTPGGSVAAVPDSDTAAPDSPTAPAVPAPGSTRAVKAQTRTLRERAAAKTGRADVLMFRVAHEHFAVELGVVEEVIDLPDVHFVPEMPETMLGVVTVRGSLTSLYSPRRALGLPPAAGQSALVFRRGHTRVAVSIDDVDDVLSLDLTALRDAPDPASDRALVLGVARLRTGLVALLDADTLLSACAAAPLQETA